MERFEIRLPVERHHQGCDIGFRVVEARHYAFQLRRVYEGFVPLDVDDHLGRYAAFCGGFFAAVRSGTMLCGGDDGLSTEVFHGL